jgi:hypothetical protein
VIRQCEKVRSMSMKTEIAVYTNLVDEIIELKDSVCHHSWPAGVSKPWEPTWGEVRKRLNMPDLNSLRREEVLSLSFRDATTLKNWLSLQRKTLEERVKKLTDAEPVTA